MTGSEPGEEETSPLLRPVAPTSLPSPLTRPTKTTSSAYLHPTTSSSSSSTLGPNEESGSLTDLDLPTRALDDDVLPETSPLGRTLGWQSAYILVISRVIGSGVFATPGAIVRSVGSPGLSLLLWVVGAIVAACGLAVALEYGSMLPRSGGDKVYLEFTYRRPRFLASTLVAVQVVLLGFTASNCIVFSQYVLFAAGVDNASDLLRKGLAVAFLAFVSVIHACFPKTGVQIQNWLGWVKVGIIAFMALAGVYVVFFRPATDARDGPPPFSWDGLWQNSVWNWGVISTTLFKVFYSYAGLENVANVLNEVKDPVRTLRSVTTTALVTSCLLYLLVNVAYFLVVPINEIKEGGELVAALFFERILGRHAGRTVLPLAVALSAGGNVMVVLFALARVKQEIARQGFLPFSELLSSTRPFGSPLGGIFVHFIPSVLVIVLPPSREVYSFILEVEGYPAQFFALAVSVGLLWLRFEKPDLKRPFRAWIPAVILRILLSLALITAPFFPPPKPKEGLFYAMYAIVGVSIVAFAVLYWYIWTIFIPRWKGYRLEEESAVLKDGTTITKLVKIPANL